MCVRARTYNRILPDPNSAAELPPHREYIIYLQRLVQQQGRQADLGALVLLRREDFARGEFRLHSYDECGVARE